MRRIALQSAIAGMIFILLGMGAAALGYLTPINGAVCQEIIDIVQSSMRSEQRFHPKNSLIFNALNV
jgi:hypothetical protein